MLFEEATVIRIAFLVMLLMRVVVRLGGVDCFHFGHVVADCITERFPALHHVTIVIAGSS